jgi:hypothetical protein
MLEKADPVTKAVNDDLIKFLEVKQRLPALQAFAKELVRVGAGRPIHNDIVYKLAGDSFDLLVIHMASLRKRIAKTIFDSGTSPRRNTRFSMLCGRARPRTTKPPNGGRSTSVG